MTVPSREEVARMTAEAMHDTYERLAPDYGYETREDTAVPWSDVPEPNRGLMIASVTAAFDALARVGHPVLMGYDHEDCECGGTGTWHNPSGLPACSENGVLGWVDCPDGEPIYWEAP